jgi:cell division protease FtsH
MANDPILPFADAARIELRSGLWVIILAGLELLRQAHFLISEHWAGYHQFWVRHVFGRFERLTRRRLSDWTRFRLWRLFTWVFWIAVLALIVGGITHSNPVTALLSAPAYIWRALPFVLQIMAGVFFVIIQFGALFWFLSRGGVDVYFPDDIKTRFSDVWGQDHVLERVKENILFLEDPELVESHGGYVPGGILLWGPPGTGKTLMAEAVAGETGRPYVFVDPGAFINMFMGVGILKVKSLFRKLRRLALRYGGVIVFFDEADSLGRRGALAQGGPNFPRAGAAAFQPDGCHGFSYLSGDVQWRLARRALDRAAEPEPDTRRSKQVMGMGMGGGGGMGTLEALLTELSGLKKPRGFANRVLRRALGIRPKPPPKYRILVMMATNLPEALDEAMLRPGRIDRIYKVGYPSKAGRIRTYKGYLSKVAHELTPEQVDKLATITPYATGATIKDLVNEALITAIRAGRDVITWQDIIRAKQLKELGPPEDVEYIERERHAVAIHEACHALVAYRTASTWTSTSPPSRRAVTTSAWWPASRRRTSSPGGAVSTRPTSWWPWPRWPASGCSSATTAPRGCPATWSRPLPWRRSWRASGAWGRRCPPTPAPSGSRSARPAAATAAGARRAAIPRRSCGAPSRTGSRTGCTCCCSGWSRSWSRAGPRCSAWRTPWRRTRR